MRPSRSRTRAMAWGVAGVRGGIATAFAIAPSATMRVLFGREADTTLARLTAAHYAARDAILGAGLARALRQPGPEGTAATRWMWAGTAADVVDLVAVVVTGSRKPRGRQRLLVAQMVTVVVTDLWLARTLTVPRSPSRGEP